MPKSASLPFGVLSLVLASFADGRLPDTEAVNEDYYVAVGTILEQLLRADVSEGRCSV